MTVQPKGKPLLSVVVPVYCEESVLDEFYARTHTVMTGLADRYEHELVFVDDGSLDRSLEMLRALAARDPHVRVVNLSRNFGHQLAITAGMDHARGDVVVVIDSDLQDPPEVIAEMLAWWEQDWQVVFGTRIRREGESPFKRAMAAVFYRILQKLSDVKLPVDAGDFRLLDRRVVEVLKQMREHHRYVRGMVNWTGFKQRGLPYHRNRRFAGKTKYTLGKMIRLAMDGVTNFSEKPLYVAGYCGLVVTGLSFAMIVYMLIEHLLHPESVVAGWTSLLLAVLFLGGLQLLSIGLLGQYIGRIFAETKGRPLYVVAGTYGYPATTGAAPSPPSAAGRADANG